MRRSRAATDNRTVEGDDPPACGLNPSQHPLRCVGKLSLVATLASTVLAALTPGWSDFDPSTLPLLLSLGAAFALSDRLTFYMEARTEAVGYSPSDLALGVGLVFVDPVGLVLARIAGTTFSGVALRRTSPLKMVFNAANYTLETTLAFALFRAAAGPDPSASLGTWLVLIMALFVAGLAAAVMVNLIVASFEGGLRDRLRTLLTKTVFYHLPPVTLAAATAISMAVAPWLGVVTVALVPMVWLVVRSHGALLHRYSDLTNVYRFSEEVGDRGDVASVIASGAAQIGDNLRADSVAVRVWDRTEEATDAAVGPVAALGDIPTLAELRSGTAPRPDRDNAVAFMVLEDERGPFGVIRVADRSGVAAEFRTDDRTRLEAMAQQLGVAVRKSQLHQQIQFDATHDRLTGLANRSFFEAWLDESIGSVREGAVLFADLDGFKEINDAFGHHTGDLLLEMAAERLGRATPPEGLAARFGGDEFAIYVPGVDLDQAEDLAASVADALDSPFVLPQATVAIASSIGIACSPDHGHSATVLLRRADAAMYHAKRSSRRFCAYDKTLDEHDSARLALLADLRHALAAGQINVHFQPKIEIDTGRVVAAEALVRWTHPERGPIAPHVFVELAQQASLIEQLTDLVMERAVAAAAQWARRGWDMSVAVNISAQSLLDERLIEMVQRHLDAADVAGSALVLEITESTMMGDPERTARMLDRLTTLGVEIAVDDFGTGFSSLSSLRSLPVAELKIDRGFVSAMDTSHNDAVIVRSTIDLAHNLGLRIVAEGVETPEVLAELKALDCDLAQGYGISHPLPLFRFNHWVSERLAGAAPRPNLGVADAWWAPSTAPVQAESNTANSSSNAVI